MVESFDNSDRQLLIKFATGRTRLAQGDKIEISMSGSNDSEFPHGTTCSNAMRFPNYSTYELMVQRVLTAIRLCGEVDADGGGEYGEEANDDDDVAGELPVEEQAVNEESDDDTMLKNTNWPRIPDSIEE